MEVYYQAIREFYRQYNGRLNDLYQYHMPYDTMDEKHLTSTGMKIIANMVIKATERLNVS